MIAEVTSGRVMKEGEILRPVHTASPASKHTLFLCPFVCLFFLLPTYYCPPRHLHRVHPVRMIVTYSYCIAWHETEQ